MSPALSLVPRVAVRRGVPDAPGRSRLLEFPRPIGVPEPELIPAPAPRPARASELLAFGAYAALAAALLASAAWSEVTIEERKRHDAIEETNENLDGLVQQYQCELLHVEADQLLEPGERWPALRDALTPEMRAWCRGER